MSGHAIKGGYAVCLEPETALCRATWNWRECDCESYSYVEQLPNGRWTHLIGDAYLPDDRQGLGLMHVSTGHVDPGSCNVCAWLNEDLRDLGPAWLYGCCPLVDGAIAVDWDGDSYVWIYEDSRAVGRMIGRQVVERWFDDPMFDVLEVEFEDLLS